MTYPRRPQGLAGTSTIRLAVIATVLVSIFAHGLTARPGINLYARRVAVLDETSPSTRRWGMDHLSRRRRRTSTPERVTGPQVP
jgi:sodium/hydrogen antiporter